MASTLPPVKGVAYNFPISLVSQADTDVFKTTVTITTADVWVSKDGGAFAAAAAAPTELLTGAAAKTGVLWQNLTTEEMNADVVTVLYHDAAGSEWQDAVVVIYTAAQTLDTTDAAVDTISGKVIGTLATGTHSPQSGDAYAVVSNATYGNSALNTDIDAILLDTGTDGVALATGAITAAVIATGAIDADAIADGAIDAGAIADGAIDAGAIAADAIGSSELAATAAAEIADAVWDELIAGHTTAGSMADELSDVDEDVWGYSDGRTLTQSSATLATISEVEITQYRGDTWDIDLADLGGMTGYGKVWFTVKEHASDYDAESLVQVEYSVGLTYINKAAATTAANGSVTVTDAASGDITIVVDESETAKLPVRNDLHYDVQVLISGAVTTLASGTFNIAADYSRATA